MDSDMEKLKDVLNGDVDESPPEAVPEAVPEVVPDLGNAEPAATATAEDRSLGNATPQKFIRDRILELRRVKASELHADEDNWRRHGGTQKKHMQAVLDDVGFAGAVIARIDEQGKVRLIDGHMRSSMLDENQEVPVLILDVTEEEAQKVLATYDTIGSFAEADRSKLEAVIRKVETDSKDVRTLLERVATSNRIIPPSYVPKAKQDLDAVPPLPKEPETQYGQMFQLGPHRLLCGDSGRAEDVRRLFGGEAADAVITDPPYGVSYQGGTKEALTIQNDDHKGLLKLLKRNLGEAYKISKTGAAWYVFGPTGMQMVEFGLALTELEVWRQTLIWVKDSFTLGRFDYHYQHETIFYGWKGDAGHKNHIGRAQSTIWECPKPKQSKDHPTMKPVDLVARCIRNSTDDGDLVYDPFGGSGTTMIASENEGRSSCLMEVEPAYVDVIRRRYQEMTGRTPELIDE